MKRTAAVERFKAWYDFMLERFTAEEVHALAVACVLGRETEATRRLFPVDKAARAKAEAYLELRR